MNEVYSHQALPSGTMVQEYRLVRVLGIGSFGIVYAAENKYFDETVAIKEYLPTDLACRTEDGHVVPLSSATEEPYRWALKHFIREAKILWELSHPEPHKSIVRVTRFHEENGTGYMVMDYEEGEPLQRILEDRGILPEEEIRPILTSLLDGIAQVHRATVWHRDIKPDNILIRPDGSPVLVDFGAAKRAEGNTAKSVMAVYSPAYAAPEQVGGAGAQGPWTDIYALGGTLYRAVTGHPPRNANERLLGAPYVPAAQDAKGAYSSALLSAIDAALELDATDRPRSIDEWRNRLEGATGATTAEGFEPIVIQQKAPRASKPGLTPRQSDDTRPEAGETPSLAAQSSGQQSPAGSSIRRLVGLALAIGTVVTIGAGILLSVRFGPSESGIAVEPKTAAHSPARLLTEPDDGEAPHEKELATATSAPSPVTEVPEPPPPASVATAAPAMTPLPDLNSVLDNVHELLAPLPCADLTPTLNEDRHLMVSGFVSRAEDIGRVRSQLAGVEGIRSLHSDLAVQPWPFCEIMVLLRRHEIPDVSANERTRLETNKPGGTFKEGEFLMVSATAGATFDGYLYIDYLDRGGTVVHLLPSPVREQNAVQAGEKIVIGATSPEDDADRFYEITPPHGQNMLVAIATERPLFASLRPEVESAFEYFSALRAALQPPTVKSSSEGIVSVFQFIETHE